MPIDKGTPYEDIERSQAVTHDKSGCYTHRTYCNDKDSKNPPSHCAYAEILPILERELPKVGHLPAIFTPAILLAARAIYGIDFSAVRPMDVVAHIAPRPIYFIHGDADHYIPASHMDVLAKAASAGPASRVQTWLVPGADHTQSYRLQGDMYVSGLVTFYTAALGPDHGAV